MGGPVRSAEDGTSGVVVSALFLETQDMEGRAQDEAACCPG